MPRTNDIEISADNDALKPQYEITAARNATEYEQSLAFKPAAGLWWKGIFWAVLFSSTLIMEGYDLALLGASYANDAFNDKYGQGAGGKHMIAAGWKAGLTNGALIGEILGLWLSGLAAEKYGHRRTMMAALLMMTGFLFVMFFAPSVLVLLVSQVLCGIPWGMFQSLGVTYASEVVGLSLRPYLSTYSNLCWVIGQLIASGVLRGVLTLPGDWSYKIPFAIQWVWPVFFMVGVMFAPESPVWLVRQGREDDARMALLRLTNWDDERFSASGYIAMISHTNSVEQSMSEGTSYADCFKASDRRRTEIACVAWAIQTFCGGCLISFSNTLFVEAGVKSSDAFSLGVGQSAIGLVAGILAWFLIHGFGRRTLYLYGCMILFVVLLSIGIMSLRVDGSMQWAIGAMFLVFYFFYGSTIGPLCYSIVSEIPATQLKAKTVVIARVFYNLSTILSNVLTSYQLTKSPLGWGWVAKSAFFWAATCFACIVWIFFRLPEPKGRSSSELTILFQRGVSARNFSTTDLAIFEKGDVASEANPT